MQIVLSKTELREIVEKATEEGVKKGLAAAGIISPVIYKSEAYALYGRWTVDRWIREGLILEHRDGPGSRVRLDRFNLEEIALKSNTRTFTTLS